MMKVLVACEESQRVCAAFRKRGHEAYSCDIIEASGGHPEWHIHGDVIPVLDGGVIITSDGKAHDIGRWDLIIAHPPCTYLTVAANRWYDTDRYGETARARYKERYKAICFFMRLALAPCDRVAVENPIGIISTAWRKPDQIIQPYMFGHRERKPTCLWLKGLPLLAATEKVEPIIIQHASGRTDSPWHFETLGLPPDDRTKARSKTFHGIAEAMAEQWGKVETK